MNAGGTLNTCKSNEDVSPQLAARDILVADG